MSKRCAITTFDNPYDPFTDFVNWYLYDVMHGYNTCNYLARFSNTSDNFTDEENNKENEKAIDEIIKYDFLGIYKKVYETKENNSKQIVA